MPGADPQRWSSRKHAFCTTLAVILCCWAGALGFTVADRWNDAQGMAEDGQWLSVLCLSAFVIVAAMSCCWHRSGGGLVATVALTTSFIISLPSIIARTPSTSAKVIYSSSILAAAIILVASAAPTSRTRASALRSASLVVILSRCFAQPALNFWLGIGDRPDIVEGPWHQNGLGFLLACASFFVGVVAAQEQKRHSDGIAAKSGEGALAMSVLSMTMTCVFAIMEWLGEYVNWRLACIDKVFFTAAAIFAMVRHRYVEIAVDSATSSDLEEPLAPARQKNSLETDKEHHLPEDAARSLLSAMRSLSLKELNAARKKMADSCQRYQVMHGIALASALFSAFALSWNLLQGNLPADSLALPMSARAAGGAGLAVSMILIVGTSSSIWVDLGHTGPVNDHSMRFVTSWKMLNLGLKLIATFNPGQDQLTHLNISCGDMPGVHGCLYLGQLGHTCSSTCNDIVSLETKQYTHPSRECLGDQYTGYYGGCIVEYDHDWDTLHCFQPSQTYGWAHACLVAATICTLLLTLFLTFTNATNAEKQKQLQMKHIARPRSMTFGYFLVFACSKLGLASLTIAAATRAQCLLMTGQVAGLVIGRLDRFMLILPVIFALAMAGMLSNEFARLTEDPKHHFSAARSADGVRALADPIVVLSSPAIYFFYVANFPESNLEIWYGEETPGVGLRAASYCAMGVMIGAILMVASAGNGEKP